MPAFINTRKIYYVVNNIFTWISREPPNGQNGTGSAFYEKRGFPFPNLLFGSAGNASFSNHYSTWLVDLVTGSLREGRINILSQALSWALYGAASVASMWFLIVFSKKCIPNAFCNKFDSIRISVLAIQKKIILKMWRRLILRNNNVEKLLTNWHKKVKF